MRAIVLVTPCIVRKRQGLLSKIARIHHTNEGGRSQGQIWVRANPSELMIELVNKGILKPVEDKPPLYQFLISIKCKKLAYPFAQKTLTMRHRFSLLALIPIALIGLPSCTAAPKTPEPLTQTSSTPQKTAIKIAGSSSAYPLLKTLSTQYEATTQTTKIEALEPGQSESVIAGVKQKIIDIGSISKTLKPEDNDGTLESREVAQDGLLVATNSSVTGITNLTTENLKAIYSGSVTNWKTLGGPDAEIVVLDRPEDESAKRLLRKHYLGAELPNSPSAIVLRKEGELIQAVQNTPHSIGAFSLAQAISQKLPVNRISLNGIEPTTETIKANQYPMLRSIVLIWHKNPSPATQAFMTHIFSASGREILAKSGFVVVSSPS
jgi:phosphate transport system substrate-binding protein